MRVTGTLELDGQSIKFEQGGDSTTLTAGAAASDITLTLPATTDTLVGLATTDTLTNKTLTSPKLNENVAVTTTATKLNYITSATGTTGTASTNIVFSTSPTLVTPVLGTPTSVTLTNATGLPVSTGISGLGSNVATFLATPSSANLAAALTDETGSGAAVFGTSPSITTPNITSYVNLLAEGAVRFNDNTGGEYAAIKAPATISASYTLTLPDTDGTANQVLLTDGSGVLSWTDMLLTNPMDSAGDLIYGGAGGAATKLDSGTAEYMLQANGAGAPSWALIDNANIDAAAAIALTKLATTTASRALVSSAGGVITPATVTATELGYLSGVTAPTGTGALVLATSPTLVTPALGTPSAAVLTNATGLPISTGVSGLAAGVATFLATPSSANLVSAVTDETGSGALVFGTSPTLTTLPKLSGSLHVGSTGAATGLTGTDFRYIGNKTANILFTDSTSAGTMTMSSGIYYDGADTRYALAGATGGQFDIITRAAITSNVFRWQTGTDDNSTADAVATLQEVGSVTGQGKWTLGVASGTQTHVLNGSLSISEKISSVSRTVANDFGANGSVPASTFFTLSSSLGTVQWVFGDVASTNPISYIAKANTSASTKFLEFGYGSAQDGTGYTSAGGIRRVASTAAIEIYAPSDRRIKENIVDYTEPVLDKLAQVRLCKFNMKNDANSTVDVGVIAQELQVLFPSLVVTTDDGTGDTLPEGVESWSVGQNWDLYLVKAIQELSARNDALQARIEALEAV